LTFRRNVNGDACFCDGSLTISNPPVFSTAESFNSFEPRFLIPVRFDPFTEVQLHPTTGSFAMADSFAEDTPIEETPATTGTDVEMVEGGDEAPAADANAPSDLLFAEDGPEEAPLVPRTTFIQYLTSPMVTLLVGSGDSETILTAHQALLIESPFFAEACAEFANDGSVGSFQQ
jgi:hypothetical protein